MGNDWIEAFIEDLCDCIDNTTVGVNYRYWHEEDHWGIEISPLLMAHEGRAAPIYDIIQVDLCAILDLLTETQAIQASSEAILWIGKFHDQFVWIEFHLIPPEDTEITGRVMRDGSWQTYEPGKKPPLDPTLD